LRRSIFILLVLALSGPTSAETECTNTVLLEVVEAKEDGVLVVPARMGRVVVYPNDEGAPRVVLFDGAYIDLALLED
jgi:hypothetical protein